MRKTAPVLISLHVQENVSRENGATLHEPIQLPPTLRNTPRAIPLRYFHVKTSPNIPYDALTDEGMQLFLAKPQNQALFAKNFSASPTSVREDQLLLLKAYHCDTSVNPRNASLKEKVIQSIQRVYQVQKDKYGRGQRSQETVKERSQIPRLPSIIKRGDVLDEAEEEGHKKAVKFDASVVSGTGTAFASTSMIPGLRGGHATQGHPSPTNSLLKSSSLLKQVVGKQRWGGDAEVPAVPRPVTRGGDEATTNVEPVLNDTVPSSSDTGIKEVTTAFELTAKATETTDPVSQPE